MLCSRCHKREAKIYYTEISNGEKKEQFLCEECAGEYTSFQNQSEAGEMTIGGLLSSIISNYYADSISKEEEELLKLQCPTCKMTYEQLMNEGKFGCADCYHVFKQVMDKGIRQIQGADVHTGKRPAGYVKQEEEEIKLTEIDKLTIELQAAVQREEYEKAAKLRDQIKELRKQEELEKKAESAREV
ncbi:UvrB/UvrC motif-containing protein [Velocimicrobium porci]|uniref:UVR domain-containing protein n=1 Tax=Velocimicrobium porci TaxID=2606634 RepID=A0A6L5XVD5_9FIRM|nr:UvrB/UvrC motif-containing protein [Velocimicrobium porci]MSS62569.1 hypothetical protein [Velocimicrobium porci]